MSDKLKLDVATAVLRYFGLEVMDTIGEGVLMLMTGEKPDGTKDCAYVRVIPGGEYAKDQSELKLLREQLPALPPGELALRKLAEDLVAYDYHVESLKKAGTYDRQVEAHLAVIQHHFAASGTEWAKKAAEEYDILFGLHIAADDPMPDLAAIILKHAPHPASLDDDKRKEGP